MTGCEVITGNFAWFSSQCGAGVVGSVPCEDRYCDDEPHRHAVCSFHLPPKDNSCTSASSSSTDAKGDLQ